MGNTSRPTPNKAQSINNGTTKTHRIDKKRTKTQRQWATMVHEYNKLTAMKATLNNQPPESMPEKLVALKAAIEQHFAAPELTEAFERVYAVHPEWEMPGWFVEKKGAAVDKDGEGTAGGEGETVKE